MNNSDFTEATRKREDDNMVEPDYGNALKDEEIFSLVSNFEPEGSLFPAQFVSIMTNVMIRMQESNLDLNQKR